MELEPNFFVGHYRLGQAYADKGMYDEALSEFNQVLNLANGKALALTGIAQTQAMSGNRVEAQKTLNEVLRLSKHQYVSFAQIGAIYIALGENDTAFEWLEEANRVHDLNIVRLKHDPRFTGLRSDPRYHDLVRRIGIP